MATLLMRSLLSSVPRSAIRSTVDPATNYYPVPDSLFILPDNLKYGLIVMGILGILSFASTLCLFSFITYRMIYWRRYYRRPIHSQQIFVLIYNLLLADMQQALSFIISLHWFSKKEIVAPTGACFAQGWLIQIGDISSGLFVLAIGLHTFYSLVNRKILPDFVFIGSIIFIWIFCLIMTMVGPLTKDDYFVRAGAWCWINESYETHRLYLHYIWIFIAELGSAITYAAIFFMLRRRLQGLNVPSLQQSDGSQALSQSTRKRMPASMGWNNKDHATTTTTVTGANPVYDPFTQSRQRVLRVAKLMVVYPIAYITLTLPLAAGRVSAMVGNNPNLTFFCIAGSMICFSGFADVILYMATRRALIQRSVGLTSEPPMANAPAADTRQTYAASSFNHGDDDDVGDAIRMDSMFSNNHDDGGKAAKLMGLGAIVVSRRISTSEDTIQDIFADKRELVSRSASQSSLISEREEKTGTPINGRRTSKGL